MKEHFPYLFWAYTLIWIFLAAYLGILTSKQRALRRQIDEIKAKLGDPGKD